MSLNGTYYVAYLILATGQLGAFSTGYGGLPGTWPSYTKSGQIVYVGPTHKTVFRMSGDRHEHQGALTPPPRPSRNRRSHPTGSKLAFVRLIDEFFNTDIFLRTLDDRRDREGSPSSPAPDAFRRAGRRTGVGSPSAAGGRKA